MHVTQGRTSKFLGSREMIPGSLHAHWTPGKPAVILLRQSLLLSILLWAVGVDGARLPLVSENCPFCLEHPLISPYQNRRQMLSSPREPLDCSIPIARSPRLCVLLALHGIFFLGLTQRLGVSSPIPPTVLFSDSPHPLRTPLQSRIQMNLEFDSRAERWSRHEDTETLAVGMLILRSTLTESHYQ